MSDVFLPLLVDVARIRFRYLDSVGVSRNPYTGTIRTASRGGDRLGATLEFSAAGGASTAGKTRRGRLLSTLMAQQGKQNRLVLTDPGYTRRGSFPSTELFTNNDLSGGSTTGWTATNCTLTNVDGVLRLTSTKATAAGFNAYQTGASCVQYAPYALRGFIDLQRRVTATSQNGTYSIDSLALTNYATDRAGLSTQVAVPQSTTLGVNYPIVIDGNGNASTAGEWAELFYSSMARCALVDNGPNLLLQSQTLDTSWTVSANSTIIANQATDPTGTAAIAEYLREGNTANIEHYVQQAATVTAAVSDHTASASIATVTRGWAVLRMLELTGVTAAYAFVNLATGALGTVSAAGNWSNARATVINQGNGWWRVSITARKTNAATSVQVVVNSATADNSFTYVGVAAQNAIAIWGVSFAASAHPVRYTVTTTVLTSGTAQNGAGIYLKGLPASTAGLLVTGDQVEFITSLGSQLCMVTASLDSSAAGLGYLQVAPGVRGTLADGAAVIITKPMGRFVLAGDVIDFLTDPGIISTASIDLEEAPA